MMELILKSGMAKLDCVTARQICFYGCFVVLSSYIHISHCGFHDVVSEFIFGLRCKFIESDFYRGGAGGRMRLKKPIYGIYKLILSYQRDGFVVLRCE